jgi:hypothetical protein
LLKSKLDYHCYHFAVVMVSTNLYPHLGVP